MYIIYSVCVCVCTHYRHVETLCLSSSSCCRLPSMDEAPPLCLANTHSCSHALCGWGGGPGVSKLLCHKVNFSAARQAGP